MHASSMQHLNATAEFSFVMIYISDYPHVCVST